MMDVTWWVTERVLDGVLWRGLVNKIMNFWVS